MTLEVSGSRRIGIPLVHGYVLTARHCLASLHEGDDLRVSTFSGETLHGAVHEVSDRADLALVRVDGLRASTGLPAQFRVRPGDDWWSPVRVDASGLRLSGTISAQIDDFKLDSGAVANVLQLLHQPNIGEYEGWSGSPIRAGTQSDDHGLVGILLQEMREAIVQPDGSQAASGLLVAATLGWIYGRMNSFNISSLAYSIVEGTEFQSPNEGSLTRQVAIPTDAPPKIQGVVTSLVQQMARTIETRDPDDAFDVLHKTNSFMQEARGYEDYL